MSSVDRLAEAFYNLVFVIDSYAQQVPGLNIVVDYAKNSYQNDPFRVFLEALLIFFAARYLFSKPERGDEKLSEREVDELIDDWEPEPLVLRSTNPEWRPRAIRNRDGVHVTLTDGSELVDFSSHNYLGIHNLPELTESAAKVVRSHGVGACGPAGFYGSSDIHLALEKQLAACFEVEEAVVYSQGFMAVASVIPAFAKKEDIIVADKSVSLAIQTGLSIARSHIYYFEHNDMDDLVRVLREVESGAIRKKWPLTRKFIVVEGLYWKTGQKVPLPRLLEIREQFKYRLIVDESLSFGGLGPRGRGITDYYGIPAEKIDIIAGSFSTILGASGGFCVGSKHVADHQRLSSQAYCFSAALPALLAASASTAIDYIAEHPELQKKLRENVEMFRQIVDGRIPSRFVLHGDVDSPLQHVQLALRHEDPRHEQTIIENMSKDLQIKGYMAVKTAYVDNAEKFPTPPSLRICLSAGHSKEQIGGFAEALLQILNQIKHT